MSLYDEIANTDWLHRNNSQFTAKRELNRIGWDTDIDFDNASYSEKLINFHGMEPTPLQQVLYARGYATNFARILTPRGKSIQVRLSDKMQSYTDSKTFITVAAAPLDPQYKEELGGFNGALDVILGLTIHEMAHVIHTSEDIDNHLQEHYKDPRKAWLWHDIMNTIEDERIEAKIGVSHPGYANYLAKTKKFMFWDLSIKFDAEKPPKGMEEAIEGVEKLMALHESLLWLVRYPALLSRAKVELCEDELRECMSYLTPYPETSSEIIKATDNIYGVFEKLLEELKEEFEQQQSGGDGESQDGEEGEDEGEGGSSSGQKAKVKSKEKESASADMNQDESEGGDKSKEETENGDGDDEGADEGDGSGDGKDSDKDGDESEGGSKGDNSDGGKDNPFEGKSLDEIFDGRATIVMEVDMTRDRDKKKPESLEGEDGDSEQDQDEAKYTLERVNATSEGDLDKVTANHTNPIYTTQMKGNRIMSLTNEYDKPTGGDITTYNDAMHAVKKYAASLRAQMVMFNRDEHTTFHELSEGQFDESKIVDAVMGDKNHFKQDIHVHNNGAAIGLLIDESGSMQGVEIRRAREIAVMFQLALKDLNQIEYYCYGHTTDWNRFTGNSSYGSWDGLDSPTVLNVYQEGKKRNNRYLLGKVKASGGNRDGHAILKTVERMRQHTKKPIVLFMISDGAPSDSVPPPYTPISYTKYCAEAVEKDHVTIIHIGINSSVPSEEMFKRYVKFSNMGTVVRELGALLKRTVTKIQQPITTYM